MEFVLNPPISKGEWNRFVLDNGGSFLQSWEWGNFQQREGRSVLRAAVMDGGNPALCAQFFRYALPFWKSYWYVPYGPVFRQGLPNYREVFDLFVREMAKIARQEAGVIFLKLEPEGDLPGGVDLAAAGFRKSDKDIQARETIINDLTSSEDIILKGMKQKARYNIKVAQRHGVKIIGLDSAQLDPGTFISLLYDTARRNKFRPHPRKYYSDMMEMFLGKEAAPDRPAYAQKIYFAYCQNEVAAAALVGFFGKRATYLHGASAAKHKNVMAPYLLHWEIMREAKRLGFSECDFWGAVTARTDKKQAKKWSGFSRFKEGFGGRIVEYLGAYDLVFDKLWYNGYRMARKINI